jgi:putative ABC transport system ATP-binding protein
MSVLSFQNVSKTYGAGAAEVRALIDVSFEVAAGETIALVGSSGSGKTTLLNVAAGLDRASEGTVILGDHNIGQTSERSMALLRRKTVGFVFQSLNLVAALTASENIEMSLALSGVGGDERRARALELLSAAGLSDKAKAFPDELSSGQSQRVAALRAAAHRPNLILMDEPTSCLDTDNANCLLDLVGELNERENTTIVLATHDARIAARMGRIVRLRDGRIIDDE